MRSTFSLPLVSLAVAGMAHGASIVTRSTTTTRNACKPYGESGLSVFMNYDTQTVNGTILAEGVFSASDFTTGNQNLMMQFEQCDFPFMNYQSGTSRNSGGSMGAPIEYFGHVRLGAYSASSPGQCMTVQTGTTYDDGKVSVRFAECNYDDSDVQLRQFFVYSPTGTGDATLRYVGTKNTTATPWQGSPYNWDAGKKPSKAFPRPILLTTSQTENGLLLQPKSS